MKTKILILALICFFVFAYCNSPANPEIEKALNPENPNPTTDVFYSCKFDLTVFHDASASGTFLLSLLEETPSSNDLIKNLGNLDFYPLPDNPDVSEGAVSLWAEVPAVPSGTYNLALKLEQYNDLVEGEVTPGEWVIKMIVSSSNLELFIAGSVQEQRYALVQVGRDTAWFTFSISE